MHDKPIRETVETLTRLYARRALMCCILALVVAPAARAAPFDARVIWSNGDRAYLVARDSVWVTASIRFFDKKKEIASGVVVAIEDSTLVVTKVTSGSLARVKHLDKVRVEVEPAASPARIVLRVGYPSTARTQPFFKCRLMTFDSRDYRIDTVIARSYRLVRVLDSAVPETLLVRLFDDAADEEIALERGELDAAVFWPGEPSSHIRQIMNWNERWSACRFRGVITTRILSPPYTPT